MTLPAEAAAAAAGPDGVLNVTSAQLGEALKGVAAEAPVVWMTKPMRVGGAGGGAGGRSRGRVCVLECAAAGCSAVGLSGCPALTHGLVGAGRWRGREGLGGEGGVHCCSAVWHVCCSWGRAPEPRLRTWLTPGL